MAMPIVFLDPTCFAQGSIKKLPAQKNDFRHEGNLVDSMVSEKQKTKAAQRFFLRAVAAVDHTPEAVTTDGHRSSPRAISETMGNHVQHRTSKYLNHRLEQDHRDIKQRSYPMRGFGTVAAAARLRPRF